MNSILKVLGVGALILLGLYAGLAMLDAAVDIADDFFYWLRYDIFPALIWFSLFGAAAYLIYKFAREVNRGL